MDWINQNRLRNWLIVVLLGLNLLTVSMLWMHTAQKPEPPAKEQGARGSESANLMKKVLDLSEEQTKQFASILASRREQSKSYNDRLSDLKMRIAEESLKENPDTAFAGAHAREVGELQSKVEMVRFRYFQELAALCTPEQKEKLRPIVMEIFGRKPPKEEPADAQPPRNREQEKLPRDTRQEKREPPTIQREERPAPPSLDEKLARYTERLNLTDDQAQKVRAVLQESREKDQELRTREHPDREEIEAAKERIRKKEDESIMRILTEAQKAEFVKMIEKRRK